jgi:hypothetical protein
MKSIYEGPLGSYSSLVNYLAQVIYAKNCSTFFLHFQLGWVLVTTMQNIRVCFLSF